MGTQVQPAEVYMLLQLVVVYALKWQWLIALKHRIQEGGRTLTEHRAGELWLVQTRVPPQLRGNNAGVDGIHRDSCAC